MGKQRSEIVCKDCGVKQNEAGDNFPRRAHQGSYLSRCRRCYNLYLQHKPYTPLVDHVGDRNGSFTVIAWNGSKAKWQFLCDCGSERFISPKHVKSRLVCRCKRRGRIIADRSLIGGGTPEAIAVNFGSMG